MTTPTTTQDRDILTRIATLTATIPQIEVDSREPTMHGLFAELALIEARAELDQLTRAYIAGTTEHAA